ncbi:hypothetical protein LA76x_3882 [Lysobacter antibioticus]|uniref:Uncharacterized protein n=1 Tax=Lysobacter antibioticus TaxID=84531 RepID=A0A0S2FEN8_LYSAN|nr:hypothetical protein LA76x_3882 [Lysobacter antibioticus]
MGRDGAGSFDAKASRNGHGTTAARPCARCRWWARGRPRPIAP